MGLIVDNDDAQRKGGVKVSFCDDDEDRPLADIPYLEDGTFDANLIRSLSVLQSCLPFRFASMHYLSSDPEVKEMYNFARRSLEPKSRVRTRAWEGMCTLSLCLYVEPIRP